MMPAVNKNPPMNVWSKTSKNVRAPEDAPQHLPYFEDDVVQQDSELVKEIEESLGQEVDLPSPSSEDNDTEDKMFYEAIGIIQEIIKRKNPGAY